MRLPTNHLELVEGYAQAVERLAKQSPEVAERASREVLELAITFLHRQGGTPDGHEQLAVWHADKFHRLMNVARLRLGEPREVRRAAPGGDARDRQGPGLRGGGRPRDDAGS